MTRKKFIGELNTLFVQTNGICGEFVLRMVFQFERSVEDWIFSPRPLEPFTCSANCPPLTEATDNCGGGIAPPPINSNESIFGKPLLDVACSRTVQAPGTTLGYTVVKFQLVSDPVDGNWMFDTTFVPFTIRLAVPSFVPAYRKVNDFTTDVSKYKLQ